MNKASFVAAVRAMHRPHMIEPSIRLVDGHANAERVLVTFDRSDLGGDDWTSLRAMTDIVERLGLTRASGNWLRRYHGAATALHVGYDGAGIAPILKLYLEYANDLRAATGPVTLYRSLKCSGETVCDGTYVADPGDRRPMDERLLAYRAEIPAPVLDVALGVARQAMRKVSSDALLLLEVRDDSRRLSFDLSVYDASLRMAEMDEAWAALAEIFKLDPAGRALLNAQHDDIFGHIACGRSGAGAPFVTLYFGARRMAGA